MAYAQLELTTNNILSITADRQTPVDVELSPDDMTMINDAKYGHAEFSYENGVLIHDPQFAIDLETARKKATASLSRMEFMLALDDAGLLATVETMIADPATPSRIRIMFNNAQNFERMHPDLVAMAQSLGLTDAQIDSVFGVG